MNPTDSYPKRERCENIWYRNDTFPENHREPAEVTRFVKDIVPSWGEYFKVYPTFDDNSENYDFTPEGILQLDKTNPIWTFSDKEIIEAVKDKVTEIYVFLNENEIEVDINRDNKTISYRTKKLVSFYLEEADYGRVGEGETRINFEYLDVGEVFHVDPNEMESKYKMWAEKWALLKKGLAKELTREDSWVKTNDWTFCLLDNKGKKTEFCLNALFKFSELVTGSKFYINMDKMRANNLKEFQDIIEIIQKHHPEKNKSNIANELSNETSFMKIDENTFALADDTSVKFNIENPESLPVFFYVWQVIVKERAIPSDTILLKEVNIGDTFVIPDAYIPPIMWKKIKPMNTVFIKISDEEFAYYKPGKTMIPEEEELEKFKKKRKTDIFYIADDIVDDYDTDWDRRIISPNIRIQLSSVGEEKTLKKKQTLDGVLEKMFKEYKKEKTSLGEYIVVNINAIAQACGQANVSFDQFWQNTDPQEQEWENPKTEEKLNVKFGNTEKFSWIIKPDNEVLITQL